MEDEGRGAIVVDTTIQSVPGAGNPFGYFTQEQVEEQDDADITRMVAEYAPTPLQFPSPNPLGLPGRGFAADLLQNPSALHACPASVPVYTPTIFPQEGPQ